MIVRRIQVERWRAFQSGVEIAALDAGLNVVHAPNGTGKSTLLEALRRGLLDGHRARGQEVEQLRPWGARLAPSVTIDFAHGGVEYRLRKRFLDEACAELSQHDGLAYQPLQAGDEATAFVRELLKADAPGRGLGEWKHAGLAQLLWAPQSGMALAALPAAVVADIQAQLGVELQRSAAPWEERLQIEYARHFTETGRVRGGKQAPPHVLAAQRLEALSARRETLEAAWRDFHAASEDIQRLREERSELEQQDSALGEKLRAARAASQHAAELRQGRAECESRARAARQAYESAARIEAALVRLQAEHQTAEAQRERAAQAEGELHGQLEGASERLRAAEADVEALRGALRASEADAARWALAERYQALHDEQRSLAARLQRIEQAEAEWSAAEQTSRQTRAPAEKDLAELRRALDARVKAEARLEMASIRLTIEPARDGRLDVIAGVPQDTHALAAGQPLELHAAGELHVDWHGVGRLRVVGPAEAAEAARETLEGANRELAQLEARLGTIDLDKLAEQRVAAASAAARASQARTQLEAALDGKPPSAWEQAGRRNAAAIAEVERQEPQWREAAPDVVELKNRADSAAAQRQRCDAATAERERLLQQFHELRRREQAATAERQHAQQSAERAQAELHRLSAEAPPPDAAQLRELAMAAHLAEAQFEAADQALAALPPDAARRAAEAEAELTTLTRRRESNLSALSAAEERLRMRAAQSPYAELAAVEDEIAALEEEIAAGRREAAAMRLLYETYHDCRRDFGQHAAETIETAALRHLGEIFGREFGSLDLNDGLAPRGFTPPTSGDDPEKLGLDRLSGGEQEQVHFAVRLALAESLAADERQLLVFDDALTATDPQRMARILRMLESAAERLQVLVLTCHPERYRPLRAARWIDLEAARRQGVVQEPLALARTPG